MSETKITNVYSDFTASKEEGELYYKTKENVTVFAPEDFALIVHTRYGRERRKKFTVKEGYIFMLQDVGNNEIFYVGPHM